MVFIRKKIDARLPCIKVLLFFSDPCRYIVLSVGLCSLLFTFGKMVISILGCGWYGKALGAGLTKQGFIVKGSTTSVDKFAGLSIAGIKPYLVNLSPENYNYDPEFFDCDILVISLPPKFKSGQSEQYLPKIQLAVNEAIKHYTTKVIYISSTGVYGDVNRQVNELDEPMSDNEHSRVLLKAEEMISLQPEFKATILRFSGLIGPGRNPGRFFAGKQDIPNGHAPVNLIHLDDCVAITLAIIKNDAFGYLFNACNTSHPAKSVFYTDASAQANLPLPQFVDELKNWKIVNSHNLEKILGYHFKSENLLDYVFL